MDSQQTLSESESLMAWLDRRIETATCASSVVAWQKHFMNMWREKLGADEVPQWYKDKVISIRDKLL